MGQDPRLLWMGYGVTILGSAHLRCVALTMVDSSGVAKGVNMANDEAWQPARLFPITGIGGAEEQERRGTSVLLAVMQSVKEFGRALTTRCGAPAGRIETFIEVPFELAAGSKVRPDGLIRVTRGQTMWRALVEVKAGRVDLRPDQLNNYLDVARSNEFDAVITISHQVATTPGVHPVQVDRRKTKKVALHHLSWSRIHTEALIQQTNHVVGDPDQAWCCRSSSGTSRSQRRARWTLRTWELHGRRSVTLPPRGLYARTMSKRSPWSPDLTNSSRSVACSSRGAWGFMSNNN